MRIGLLGFPFADSNKGCEALTYSFIHILQEVCGSNIEIYNLSYDNNLGKVPEFFDGIHFVAQKIKVKDFKLRTIKYFKDCDYIFDITFGDNFSDIYSPKLVMKTSLMKQLVNWSGTPLILAPQTYGPFNNKWLEKFAVHIIKKSFRVYSRDQLSTRYIKQISGVNAITVTDLAFALPYDYIELPFSVKTRVGLNVSGLLWRGCFTIKKGGFPSENKFGLTLNYQQYIKDLIEYLLKHDYEVHLIPHVIASPDSPHDGDVEECKILKELYREVMLAPAFNTPIEAKSYIAQMDVFVGARMHSTIAAFSAGVATIPFSYSRKFEGLYGNLNYKYLVSGTKSTNVEALAQTIHLIENRKQLKSDVDKMIGLINENILEFKNSIKDFLNS